ncbi:alanine--tRNA ligase [Caerostris extrusa]|uniref:alanine--tRNA ligase n=1 Tax=Caerostris extrusa TaxID=172846 RepID=A0AAV4MUN8_CAEEX|nr:alanine--tRNA ligase [Caerostris extrusa]
MNLDDSGNIIKIHKIDPKVIQDLQMKNVLPTNDVFKYDYYNKAGVKQISAKVIAVIRDGQIVDSVERGLNCQLVLDKTNFYAEGDDQAGDEGILSCKKKEMLQVAILLTYQLMKSIGLACSRNHTALHILSAVLKNNLSYFFPLSANVGPKELSLNFTTKGNITDGQLKIIEKNVQDYINAKLDVTQYQMPLETLKDMPPCKTALIKEFAHLVPVVEIGKSNEQGLLKSVEPCCGTHVKSTEEVGSFIIISQNTKDKEKVIRAVTGKQALIVGKDGQNYDRQLTELEKYVTACLEKPQVDVLELWDCLKEIKEAKVYHETELPLMLFREHQEKLSELREKLAKATNSFVQNGFKEVKQEMTDVLKKFSKENFIVHHLSSVGDGRRIINYAIDHSGEKPALYFVKDGYKSIICSCSVPKSFVDSSFSALLWINPVASVLEGRARTSNKDQELYYSVVSKRTHKVEQAIDIAKRIYRISF